MRVLRRRAAECIGATGLALAALAGPGAKSAPAAPPTELAFESARPKDDLAGAFDAAHTSARLRFRASAGSKLTLTGGGDSRSSVAGAPGIALTFATAAGGDLSASLAGRTKALKDGSTQWKSVPIDATGEYDVGVGATGDGSWRVRFTLSLAPTNATETSSAAPGESDEVEFDGFAGGTAKFTLKPTGKASNGKASRFVGQPVRLIEPDGGVISGSELPTASSGKVTLRQDGRYRLEYQNVGSGDGQGQATVKVTAPKAYLRTGYVEEAGTWFRPVVRSIDPTRSFHRDEALPFAVFGRDFQVGADVRLRLKGRDDIVATSVDVVSETEIRCLVDIDTIDTQGQNSVGNWTTYVTNGAERGDPRTQAKGPVFASLSAASIRLPQGVMKNTEVWHVEFADAFEDDLDRILGFPSGDQGKDVREACREAVQAYAILYLRDAFEINETTGALKKGESGPVSFVIDAPPRAAGEAGTDYNRITVGGAWQEGDERDPAEPLLWGGLAAPDTGNTVRNLVLARTRVLDPDDTNTAASGWTIAMTAGGKLNLTANDLRFFTGDFNRVSDRTRYSLIVRRVERCAREVAAILAHHVGKATGLPSGAATGPMSNPTRAGDQFPLRTGFRFSAGELASLRTNAVPHALPGSSARLTIGYFATVADRSPYLGTCVTPKTGFSVDFSFVGGRPNAVPGDYRVQYVTGAAAYPPFELKLTYTGLSGSVPISPSPSVADFYCFAAVFRLAVTDRVRGGTEVLAPMRLDVYPDVNHPSIQSILPSVQACIRNLPAPPAD